LKCLVLGEKQLVLIHQRNPLQSEKNIL